MNIPFNRADLGEQELAHVAAAMRGHVSGDGPYSRKCQSLLEQSLGVHRALVTTSCTHALEMAALLLDIQPGDEVIVPSFTFVSTANAFALRGAKPVFADIRPDTLNLDDRQLSHLITPRTRAIVPVHYAGVGCEMDAIMAAAETTGIAVVEDNAHGLFGKFRGRWLGTFGCLAAQSFHETKNITCGEGGALLINRPEFVQRSEVLREKGTDRSRFFRGEIDKYGWVDLGSSYVLSDLLSAVLFAQLERRGEIQSARRAIWERYRLGLGDWAALSGSSLPHVPEHCEQAYHMFYILLPDLRARQSLIEHLRERGILSVFHYVPLHRSQMASRCDSGHCECPVTDRVSDRLVRLPFYTSLTESEQDRVIEAIHEWPGRAR